MIDQLGGRKMVLALLFTLIGGVLAGLRILPVAEYVDLMKWIMGLFVVGAGLEYAGETVQKFAK